ncbi:MAG TPA: sugar ABC transporter ATP-binding protein [Candidatus Binatia bacterium]|nr:sugar ABC transporter ATP-binding protein [Candidatus Binatia bacterium]
MPNQVALRVDGAEVRYGETTALAGVSLEITAGRVHALVGENGAGKSTLLKALAGMTALDAGTIAIAAGLRVEWVPQELALVPDLTVAETMFLGRERRGRCRLLQRRTMEREAAAALATISCRAAPGARIAKLSAPVRKQVQLARGFATAADVLLLDEPTAVLGGEETRALFRAIDVARTRGAAVVYVSHQIAEVLAIADVVTVLRDGRQVSTDPVALVDTPTIVSRMVGRPLIAVKRFSVARQADRPRRLQVRELCAGILRDVSFDVAAGEIVGVTGLVGAGRSDLLECIAGTSARRSGHVEVHGTIALVPEDRIRKGLVPTLSLHENVFLPAPHRWLRTRAERRECARWLAQLHIRSSGIDALPTTLSGGNQQKVLLARALRRTPDILLLDEPTAGVDIAAKAEIHDIVRAHAAAGAAVVMASSDLPELLGLCDRIIALRNGEQVGVVPIAEATEPRLAELITGAA